MQGSYRRVACAGLAIALPCMSLAVVAKMGTSAAAATPTVRTVMVPTMRFGDDFEHKRFSGWPTVRTGVGGRIRRSTLRQRDKGLVCVRPQATITGATERDCQRRFPAHY